MVAAVRHPFELEHRFPQIELVKLDMNAATSPDDWRPHIQGCDAIANCAGILQDSADGRLQSIHFDAPKALFDAAIAQNVRRVVHISAVSANPEAGTAYAVTKHACDQYLQGLDLDWVILRPSLVYGAQSYGGTSLMRAFAALPRYVPLIGQGDQTFQPIFVNDLAETVMLSLQNPELVHKVIAPVGPESLSYKHVLLKMRGWLGLPPPRFWTVPGILVHAAVWLGDKVRIGPLNSTSLRQIEFGNAAPVEPFKAATGLQPLSMDQAFAQHPSFAQEIWHARLYFLKPAIRIALALMWILSGIIGLFAAHGLSLQVMTKIGAPPDLAPALTVATCVMDIAIGCLLLLRGYRRIMGPIQLGVITLYTIGLTLLVPALWLDPLGPLLKNLPILLLVLVSMATEQDR